MKNTLNYAINQQFFCTQKDVLLYIFGAEEDIPGFAKYNLWKHLTAAENGFKKNKFYGFNVVNLGKKEKEEKEYISAMSMTFEELAMELFS